MASYKGKKEVFLSTTYEEGERRVPEILWCFTSSVS